MLPIIAIILVLAFDAGIMWVLLSKYRQTHNLGFLILGFGLLVWPLVGGLLRLGMRTNLQRLGNREAVFFPFSWIMNGHITLGETLVLSAYADQAIRAGLILIGLLVIGGSFNRRNASITG